MVLIEEIFKRADDSDYNKNNPSKPRSLSSYVLIASGLGLLIGSVDLGPIDLCRTIYNNIIGETPILKEQLANYCRRMIVENLGASSSKSRQIDDKITEMFYVRPVDPSKISISELWDASEDLAPSFYQRWVWPSLKD